MEKSGGSAGLCCTASAFRMRDGFSSSGRADGKLGFPQKTYTVKAYLCPGNATTDFSVRCEVITTSTGESRNLYWGYRQEEAQVQWKDDHTVEINGKTLDAESGTYDWRVDGE